MVVGRLPAMPHMVRNSKEIGDGEEDDHVPTGEKVSVEAVRQRERTVPILDQSRSVHLVDSAFCPA